MAAIVVHMSTRTRPTTLVAGIISLMMIATFAGPAAATTPAARAATTGAAAAQAAADPDPIPEPKFRFTGYGTDHGVGLSQRGAAGRAAAGQTYDQILDHYFWKTRLGRVPQDTTIRALVVKSYRAASTQTALVQGGLGGPGKNQVSRWTFDTPGVDGQSFPNSWRLVLIGRGESGAWKLEVQDAKGIVKLAITDSDARLTVRGIANDPDPGRIRVLIRPTTRYDTYEGDVRIGRADGRLRVVNVVAIEPFVRSVSPQELGPSNMAETLKSQAVVARSYFLAGLSTATGFLASDVESYRDSQSYKGTKGENSTVTQAVDATAYQVVAYKGTPPSGPRRVSVIINGDRDPAYYIARTFYHAVGGGATEASQNVFTGATGKPGSKTPYLRGGPDTDADGVPYDETARDYEWSTRTFTLAQLSDILGADSRTDVGTLTSWPIEPESTFRTRRAAALLAGGDPTPDPSNRGVSGRLTWVVLKGTKHGKPVTKQVAGWLFKSVFNAHRGSGDPLGSTMIFRAAAD